MQKFINIILRVFTNVNKNDIVVLLHYMKANKGGGCRDPLILNLGVICWWSASHPGGRARGTHWTGRWASSTAGLDELEKRETSCPRPIRTPDCPGRNLAINVNYFARALNVLIKAPARDFLKTSACCYCSFVSVRSDNWFTQPTHLQFRRNSVQTYRNNSVFSLSVSPDYLSASCLRRLYSRTATKKAMTQYRCFLSPALNFASADTQW